MNAVPFIPDTAPFSTEQKAWLNGFLAGIFSRAPGAGAGASSPAAPLPVKAPRALTLVYASQTGTCERLAKKASKLAGKRGFAPKLVDAAQFTMNMLTAEKNLLLLTSTYGDGEAPDSAKRLLNELKAASGSPLAQLHYSVCAVGDSNYAKFCQAGKDFDASLHSLGATRLVDRVECDVGQEDKYTHWLEQALTAVNADAAAEELPRVPDGQAFTTGVSPAAGHESEDEEETLQAPFLAKVMEVRRITASGSAKEVNHVAFSLEGSGLSYEAGDALSVTPTNDPELVGEILALLGSNGSEVVNSPSGQLSLCKALSSHYDLGKAPAALLALLGLDAGAPAPHHVIDTLLAAKNKRPSPAAFVAALRPLQPRLYSISSSPLAYPGQVHLTVGAVRYEMTGRRRKGLASCFLAERARLQGTVAISVHKNGAFRLPANPGTPVIMVGPGTGIAPFRSFIHERIALGAKTGNWLFFGDQRSATDFLYQDELAPLVNEGSLRLSLAWSRDQSEKVYVQNRLQEQAAELWSWLENGAHFYVCGDASRMAKDVDAALHKVVETAGSLSPESAVAYVENLKSSRRYQRDVY